MINFSILTDAVYASTATTLNYYVTVDGTVVFRGRAKAGPDGIRINLRRIAKDWMENQLRDFLPLQGEIVAHPEALRTFTLYDAETDAVLEQFTVLFDFADEWNGGTLQMNDPVNGHADPRQKIFIGNGSPTANEQDIDDIPVKGDFFRIVSVPDVPFEGGVHCITFATSYDDITVDYSQGLTLVSLDEGSACFRFPYNDTDSGKTWTVCFEHSGETLECVDVHQGVFTYADGPLTIKATVPFSLAIQDEAMSAQDVYIDGEWVSPVEYLIPGGDWTHFPKRSLIGNNSYANVLEVNSGSGVVHLRATDCGPQPNFITYDGCGYPPGTLIYRDTVSHLLYGNVLSIEYGDDFRGVTRFNKPLCSLPRFGCASDAGNLVIPMTVAEFNGIYQYNEGGGNVVTRRMGACARMFDGDTYLTVAPVLNFTKIEAFGCYSMFRQTSLTTCQDLEATEYGIGAVADMYRESLVRKGPKIYARYASVGDSRVEGISKPGSFSDMFKLCMQLTETAEFMYPVNIPSEIGGTFSSMYADCEALVTTHPIRIANVKSTRSWDNFGGIYCNAWNVTSAEFELKNVGYEEFQVAFDCDGNIDHSAKVTSITIKADSFDGPPPEYPLWEDYFTDWLRDHQYNGTLYLTQAVADKIPRGTDSGVPSGWTVQVIQ